MVKRNVLQVPLIINPQKPFWKVTGLEHTSQAFAN